MYYVDWLFAELQQGGLCGDSNSSGWAFSSSSGRRRGSALAPVVGIHISQLLNELLPLLYLFSLHDYLTSLTLTSLQGQGQGACTLAST